MVHNITTKNDNDVIKLTGTSEETCQQPFFYYSEAQRAI